MINCDFINQKSLLTKYECTMSKSEKVRKILRFESLKTITMREKDLHHFGRKSLNTLAYP